MAERRMAGRSFNAREICAGAIFLAFGIWVVAYARDYDIGTATRMGPGYFPTLLGLLLTLLGLIAMGQGFRRSGGRVTIGAWPLLPTAFVIAGVLLFAWLVSVSGLVPAVVGLVVLVCYERLWRRPIEVAVLSVVLALLAVGIFIYGIQLPLDLW